MARVAASARPPSPPPSSRCTPSSHLVAPAEPSGTASRTAKGLFMSACRGSSLVDPSEVGERGSGQHQHRARLRLRPSSHAAACAPVARDCRVGLTAGQPRDDAGAAAMTSSGDDRHGDSQPSGAAPIRRGAPGPTESATAQGQREPRDQLELVRVAQGGQRRRRAAPARSPPVGEPPGHRCDPTSSRSEPDQDRETAGTPVPGRAEAQPGQSERRQQRGRDHHAGCVTNCQPAGHAGPVGRAEEVQPRAGAAKSPRRTRKEVVTGASSIQSRNGGL